MTTTDLPPGALPAAQLHAPRCDTPGPDCIPGAHTHPEDRPELPEPVGEVRYGGPDEDATYTPPTGRPLVQAPLDAVREYTSHAPTPPVTPRQRATVLRDTAALLVTGAGRIPGTREHLLRLDGADTWLRGLATAVETTPGPAPAVATVHRLDLQQAALAGLPHDVGCTGPEDCVCDLDTREATASSVATAVEGVLRRLGIGIDQRTGTPWDDIPTQPAEPSAEPEPF